MKIPKKLFAKEVVQPVRLMDVFVVGPTMIYAARKLPEGNIARPALTLMGALTMLYNGANYLRIERGGRQA